MGDILGDDIDIALSPIRKSAPKQVKKYYKYKLWGSLTLNCNLKIYVLSISMFFIICGFTEKIMTCASDMPLFNVGLLNI